MAAVLKEEEEEEEEEDSDSDSDEYIGLDEEEEEEEEEEDPDPMKGQWESWKGDENASEVPIDRHALLSGLMESWSFRKDCIELDIWCSVMFYNMVKGEHSSLTQGNFKAAFEGCDHTKKADELEKLYSDIVFSSSDSRMSFQTFREGIFRLWRDKEFKQGEIGEGDVERAAGVMEGFGLT
jgi:hypothetical protein